MKTKVNQFKCLLILFCLFLIIGTGCEKDEEIPPFHAKGTIIEITGQCYGEMVLIEVEKPQGIGESGTFSRQEEKNESITYKNAIGVPYFSKIGIPDSIPQIVGTCMYFEYRELTDTEKEQASLFSPDPPIICKDDIIPPSAKRLIVSKVISYK